MSKIDFTQNLSGENIKNFSKKNNEKKNKKVSLLINADKNVIDQFKILAFDYYRNADNLVNFSFSNFLEVGINRFIEGLKKENKEIIIPSDNKKKFFKKKQGRKSDLPGIYKVYCPQKISFTINQNTLDDYFNIMNTFYDSNRNYLLSYSASIFFVDFVNFLLENK